MTRRLRRLLRAGAALVLVIVLSAACSSDGFPVSYDDQAEDGISNVEANWNEGCQVSLTEDLAAEANAICGCAYDEITQQVPFEDFVEVNDELKSNPEALTDLYATNPAAEMIVDIVRDCISR